MADQQQDAQGQGAVDRQTIREVLTAHIEARRQEELERQRAERRKARDDRATARKEAKTADARQSKARRLRAANEAQARVAIHVAAAARSVRAALRAATEVAFPRHSPEGRQQTQTVRRLQEASGALRRVGGGAYDETDFEIDLDLDV